MDEETHDDAAVELGKAAIKVGGRVTPLTLPTGYLSPTQLSMWLRCPRQYEYRYVEGLKMPPAVAKEEGIAHHLVFATDNECKRVGAKAMTANQMVEMFVGVFEQRAHAIPHEEWKNAGEKVDDIIKRGRAIQTMYAGSKERKAIDPLQVEKPFTLDLAGLPVHGIVDLLEKGLVSDYKVVARTPSDSDVNSDLQLSTYALATEAKMQRLVCLTKTETPKVVCKPTTRSKRELRHTTLVYHQVALAITAGCFPPCDPKSWACSERMCGYWHLCRGKK